jgi:hypothetical protein
MLLAATCLVPATGHAQAIQGTVVDSAGRPLPGALVILAPADTRTTTDERGRFTVRAASGARHVLRVVLIGFRPHEERVEAGRFARPVRVVLRRMPQLLDTVRVSDQDVCDPTSLRGFECRRAAGEGVFRDAGELRALKPMHWADMFDGIPGMRRVMRMGPHGLEWRPAAPPSRCYNELFNGQPPMEAGPDLGYKPDELWRPNDVVALEVYDEYSKVPVRYQRYAWPPFAPQCGLIIYWLRGADPGVPPTKPDTARP